MKALIKSILLPSLILYFSLSAFSVQAQEIFYSKEMRYNFQNDQYAVVGKTSEGIFTYTATGDNYFLNDYNDSMALKAKIALDFFPAKARITKFISYPENIIVFYQAEERNYMIQYAALLDKKALLIGKSIAIDSVKTTWLGMHQHNFFDLSISSDKNKIMLYSLDKKDLRTTLLDNHLNILGRGKHHLSFNGKSEIHQALLDNDGRFYFTLLEKAGSKQYTALFQLFQLSENGRDLVKKTLPGNQDYYSGLFSKINKNNGLIYSAGFYSNRKSGNLEGLAYFVYDPKVKNFEPIKKIEFENELKAEQGTRNKNKAFNDSKIRNLIIKNDGGFLIISEDAYSTSRTITSPDWGFYSWYYAPSYPNQSIREFHYGNILVMNFNESGDMLWHTFIRKSQYTQDDNGLFSSYAFLNSGASLVFLFNNLNNRNYQVMAAVVDADGSKKVQALDVGNIGNAEWLPRKATQISKTTWLMPILTRNNLFFVRVAF